MRQQTSSQAKTNIPLQHLATVENRLEQTTTIIERYLQSQNTVVSSTKFSSDSIVFLHLITSIEPELPIIWIDTGYNSRETLAYAKEAESYLNLNLHIFRPTEKTLQVPPNLDDPEHLAFSEQVKLAPFRKALKKLGATHWISSVRSYQTPNREALPIELKLSNSLTKLHPMLEWSKKDIEVYRYTFDLPVGPEAYDPTKGNSRRECGLHKIGSFFN